MSGFIPEAHLPGAITIDGRYGVLVADDFGSLYNQTGQLVFRASTKSIIPPDQTFPRPGKKSPRKRHTQMHCG